MIYYANWKLNKKQKDIEIYFEKFNEFDITKQDEICFFVSSPMLFKAVNSTAYPIGAQNVCYQLSGAFTGETSLEQVLDLGVSTILVGHSERRNIFNETNDDIAKKVMLLNAQEDVNIVLCIGERIEEKTRKFEILQEQIEKALSSTKKLNRVVIAYEPVWSIGTGLIPTTDEIEETIVFIKKCVKECFDYDCKVLYGGSVNESNVKTLKSISNLDGFLVGGASLDAEKFFSLIKG